MRLVNCTDFKTPKLERHGLVNQSIEVDGVLLKPGEGASIPDKKKAHFEKVHAHLISVGALAWGAELAAPAADAAPETMAEKHVEVAAPATEEAPAEEPRNALVDMSSEPGSRKGHRRER